MKNLFILLVVSLTIFSCSHPATTPKFYGEKFDTTKAITTSQLASGMQGQTKLETVVKGKVTASCKDDGCWLNLENGSKEILVDWDHRFNIPLDMGDRMAIVNGYAYYDSTNTGMQLAFKATGLYL